MEKARREGMLAGMTAAALFGASAPMAKLLLPGSAPLPLAALLYLRGGFGLAAVTAVLRKTATREAALRRADVPLLLAIALSGGLLGSVLLLIGLQHLIALSASLLLNLEAPSRRSDSVSLLGAGRSPPTESVAVSSAWLAKAKAKSSA